ncbi:MAG: hypothetical protein JSS83_22230 [Cyanobacteria bacterium SZAS LIN-3]|nr:hypothetical protein [Cyanobacteria bacterium SZAS LIN-3]MBS2005754.1 hypothetical protein [Cyanobacteria bacterium SZAS TMP-1]
MKIFRSINEPIVKQSAPFAEKFTDFDNGLINAWEVGRREKDTDPALANQALNGELVVLPWKGGVTRELKVKKKFGTLHYIAMWQGLRGEDLDIDTESEIVMTCTATNMIVTFTADSAKYGEP